MVQPPASATTSGKGGGMMRSSAIFSGMTLVSRLGRFRARYGHHGALGASIGPAADAYYTALNFPNLFRRIFAEGAFAAAFVPAYARTLETEGQEAADRVATDALAVIAAITVALTILAQLTMPWIMTVMNSGFLDDPVRFKLAVVLTQITMPYLPCMAVAALLSGRPECPGPVHRLGRLSDPAEPDHAGRRDPGHRRTDPAAYAASWAVRHRRGRAGRAVLVGGAQGRSQCPAVDAAPDSGR